MGRIAEGVEEARNAYTREYPKVSGLGHNEINNNNNKHSLRSYIKDYGDKTHCTDLQIAI
jgi:hypothetical protein